MLCQRARRYFHKNPMVVMHVCCFVAFTIQMGLLAMNQINPLETVSHIKEMNLDDIDFPVVFKICIKPAFNISELHKVGYKSIWGYFKGQSMYNASIYGWGGHYKNGTSIGTVEGEVLNFLKYVNLCILRYTKENTNASSRCA